MKTISYLVTITIFITACNQSATPDTNNPEAKKALLEQKIAEYKNLESEIATLTAELNAIMPNHAKPAVTVTFDTISTSTFYRYVDLQAVVEADDIVSVAGELGGRITRLHVKEGQSVKKGQLVATLDVESLEKQKDEILKSLDLANDVFDRQKRLWDQQIGSEVQYLQAKNNKERIEKSLQTLETQLRKRNIYAPLSGIVDQLIMKEGEMTAPGSPIIRLLNVAKVKIVTDAPESYLGKIKTGDKVQINIPAIGKDLEQKITLIGRTIDPANRTFKLEVRMDNPGEALKPNLLAIVKINDFTMNNAIAVPVDVVQQEVTGRKYVYVIGQSDGLMKAEKVYIETGESADGKILVKSGLKSGDRLIIKGARNVTDGASVKTDV